MIIASWRGSPSRDDIQLLKVLDRNQKEIIEEYLIYGKVYSIQTIGKFFVFYSVILLKAYHRTSL